MMKRMELLLFSRYPFFFIEIYFLSAFKNELGINFIIFELCGNYYSIEMVRKFSDVFESSGFKDDVIEAAKERM